MDQNDINRLRGKTAVVGLAESGCGLASGWSAMEIMASAVHDALDDAGIKLKEVDGVFAATAFHSMAAMSLSEYLGVKPKFADGSQIGGSSFLSHILTAAMALEPLQQLECEIKNLTHLFATHLQILVLHPNTQIMTLQP